MFKRFSFIPLLLCLLCFAGMARAADPTSISGLNLYLRADAGQTLTAGRVSAWADQSGAGNNSSQATAANQPVPLSGTKQAVAFETYPLTEYLSLPSSLSRNEQAFSAFAVVDWVASGYGNVLFGSSAGVVVYLYANAGHLYYNNGSPHDTGLLLPSSRSLVGVVSSGTTLTFYVNNQSVTVAGSFTAQTVTGGWLGAYGTSATLPGAFNLYAFLHYSRALTAPEVNSLLSWAAQSYALRLTPRTSIVFAGDSITFGYGISSNNNWVQQLNLPVGCKFYGMGYNSQQIGTMGVSGLYTSAGTTVDTLLDNSLDQNILVLFAGTNDIVSTIGNVSGATAYSRLVAYCQARRTAGWTGKNKILVVTLLPRNANGGGGGLFEPDRTVFNSSVLSGSASFCDGVIDIGSDPVLGATANLTNTLYYFDGTHPTSLGDGIIAGYVETALRRQIAVSTNPVSVRRNQ